MSSYHNFTAPATAVETQTFEWNVFEQQFLDWHHQPLSSSTATDFSSSPDSLFDDLFPLDESSWTIAHPQIEMHSPGSSSVGELGEHLDDHAHPKSGPKRRTMQNRKAQRAFRARQKVHVETLEARLETAERAYTCLKEDYERLSIAHGKLGGSESQVGFDLEIKREGLNSEDGSMAMGVEALKDDLDWECRWRGFGWGESTDGEEERNERLKELHDLLACL